ncbi:(2Fe-2S)-binding protein [Streptomyces fuscigenes]|uniref:(2Fe-2S)-binding protein n=1 Tax=Streptomyces fuscigenes TaxID=1528880 RepID=UPI001F43B3EC|nr:(2Fe-2S)-binding protein [Streptomyces fuscigenes]MCF3962300.1 (2Fe-2S)-binding protein [Streptomyces fuscigenes]
MTHAGPYGAALDALARSGPFFTVEVHDPSGPPDAPWRPLSGLVDEAGVLSARVGEVQAHLARAAPATAAGAAGGAVERRVAASVAHLGLVARVLSPFFALTALHGAPTVPALGDLRWCPRPGGAFPLSLPRTALVPSGLAPEACAGLVLGGLVAPLGAAVSRLSVSPRTLAGNAASAVNGARAALTAAVPGDAERIARTAAAFLAHESLRGAHEGGADGRAFRRRSCCLIYRAAPGPARTAAVCGDCVLARG